jgi:hypothetical protein
MAIVQAKKLNLPKRQWALASFANTGKSTFAASMRKPILATDSDDRFPETMLLLGIPEKDVLMISDKRGDHVDADYIAKTLGEARKQRMNVGTLLVDSFTGIIQPKIVEASEATGNDRATAMRDKANTMRKILDAIQNFGGDYLLVWHHETRGNKDGEKRLHETVPPTERDAMTRALNMELVTVREDRKDGSARFGVQVVWARYGEFGMTIWDEPGNYFRGMPERIEQAVYAKGVKDFPAAQPPAAPAATYAPSSPATPAPSATSATQQSTDAGKPTFADKAEALKWAVAQKIYPSYEAASEAYAKVRADVNPTSAEKMFSAWLSHCEEQRAPAMAPAPQPEY